MPTLTVAPPPTTAGTRRAVAYMRVSTASQAEQDRASLDTQAAHIAAYCRDHGLALVRSFTDVGSGRRDDRPSYQAMLAFLRAGHADVAVVQFLDRFGRNPREILGRIWSLQEQRVEVACTDESIAEELVMLVRAGLAGAESKRTSERVKAAMREAAGKGVKFGVAPYGYCRVRDGEHVTYVQAPHEAGAVRRMVALVLDAGRGPKAIADALNAEGLRARGGMLWSRKSVLRVLGSEAIAGVLVFGQRPRAMRGTATAASTAVVRVADFYPRIVTADEWDLLATRLALRREHPRGRVHVSRYLLSGLLRCGLCGGSMSGRARHGRTRRDGTRADDAYYRCTNHERSRQHCPGPNNQHAAGRLEATVLAHLGQYSDSDRVRALLAQDAAREDGQAADELRQVERALAALDHDFSDNLRLLKAGVLDEREFGIANAQRRTERASIEARRAELAERAAADQAREQAAETLPGRISDFLATFERLDVIAVKPLLAALLRAIRVWPNNAIELEFRE